MSERDPAKEIEGWRESSRKAHVVIDRLRNAVRIAARMEKPTETEVNQLISLAERDL